MKKLMALLVSIVMMMSATMTSFALRTAENGMIHFTLYNATDEQLAEMVANGTIPSDVTSLDLSFLYGSEGLTRGKLSDITPLSELTNLDTLSLGYNQITDLSPLAELKKLHTLLLDGNLICDLSPLSELTNLHTLTLNSNQVSDLTPVAKLTNLVVLRLHSNQISDIAPLKKLTNLTTLILGDNHAVNTTALTRSEMVMWITRCLEPEFAEMLDEAADDDLFRVWIHGSHFELRQECTLEDEYYAKRAQFINERIGIDPKFIHYWWGYDPALDIDCDPCCSCEPGCQLCLERIRQQMIFNCERCSSRTIYAESECGDFVYLTQEQWDKIYELSPIADSLFSYLLDARPTGQELLEEFIEEYLCLERDIVYYTVSWNGGGVVTEATAAEIKNLFESPRLTILLPFTDSETLRETIHNSRCGKCGCEYNQENEAVDEVIVHAVSQTLNTSEDREYTISDAIEILKYTVGLPSVHDDSDTSPTVDEAIEILKYVAGLCNAISGNDCCTPSDLHHATITPHEFSSINEFVVFVQSSDRYNSNCSRITDVISAASVPQNTLPGFELSGVMYQEDVYITFWFSDGESSGSYTMRYSDNALSGGDYLAASVEQLTESGFKPMNLDRLIYHRRGHENHGFDFIEGNTRVSVWLPAIDGLSEYDMVCYLDMIPLTEALARE
jgi:hypothetical protein